MKCPASARILSAWERAVGTKACHLKSVCLWSTLVRARCGFPGQPCPPPRPASPPAAYPPPAAQRWEPHGPLPGRLARWFAALTRLRRTGRAFRRLAPTLGNDFPIVSWVISFRKDYHRDGGPFSPPHVRGSCHYHHLSLMNLTFTSGRRSCLPGFSMVKLLVFLLPTFYTLKARQ